MKGNYFFTFLIVLVNLAIVILGWTRTEKEIRMPKELRVVNEGLSHDEEYWYLTNQHFIYKTTINPMTIVASNHHAIPEELGKQRYNHIGDIDVFEGKSPLMRMMFLHYSSLDSVASLLGAIIGGMESSEVSEGILAAWNTSDLSIIKYKVTPQHKMPWVAVNPKTRLAYSAVWNDCCNLQVYNVDTFDWVGTLTAVNGLPREIQGAAFYQDDLYLSVNGNCSIYKLDMKTNETSFVLSDEPYDHHEMEMEGLTFWDLSARGLGVMHMYGNFETVREKSIHSFDP